MIQGSRIVVSILSVAELFVELNKNFNRARNGKSLIKFQQSCDLLLNFRIGFTCLLEILKRLIKFLLISQRSSALFHFLCCFYSQFRPSFSLRGGGSNAWDSFHCV